MRGRLGWTLGALLLLVGTAGCSKRVPEAAASEHPAVPGVPTVYVAKRIRTLDAARPEAQALAVRDGKVLAVGTREEVLAAVGPTARVVELGDATVVPGLTDSHGHLAGLASALVGVRLEGTATRDEVRDRLSKAPPTAYQGEWLLGQGWDQNHWPEKAFPTHADLDAAFPRTPVALGRVDGHALWLNSEALRRARIDRNTKDPRGGRILRGPDGEPTGVLVDNAMDLAASALPAPTDAQRAARLTAALEHCARVGLTGVHDAGMDLRTFRLLQDWDKAGTLPLRIYAMADGQTADREQYLKDGPFQGKLLTMRAVKLTLDGALGSRGAALHAAYSDEPGHQGLLLLSPEEYAARVHAFVARGFQVATHAIGDRANTLVLDTLLHEMEATGKKDGRHRVEHAQIMTEQDIARLGANGFVASVQPTHATSDMPWAQTRVGPERIHGAYAWQKLKAAGAVLTLGSDFPVERPDVLAGLYAARTRQDASGQPPGGWQPDQRLSGMEALEGFTVGAAYASFAEDRRGRLKQGQDADFVALSVDPVDAPPADLLTAQVRMTVVAGREVFRADAK
ncbi:amidohydrolase [Corallococcus silvisoli]|uniref:amidohydrolase n=1 Tax=Corallococcus silvisoli TaxID=2697031 RepID=UPI0013767AD3|nr:amidohydrolase [Corallococcus silvisoli]NBD10487.1 amidohydrolase family protein [Corallococcus silvisoli]